MWIRIRNEGKAIPLSGEVKMTATIVAPNSILSHNLPEGEITCDFFGGNCNIPGSPFSVQGAGIIQMTLKAEGWPDIKEDIEVVGVKPVALKLSIDDPAQGPAELPCPDIIDKTNEEKPCIVIGGNSKVFRIYPYLVDNVGEYIHTSAASWKITGPLAEAVENLESQRVQEFFPATSGTGTFVVKTPTNFEATYSYQVLPRKPVSLEIITTNDGDEVAGEPFTIQVAARDLNSEVSTLFEGNLTLNFISKGNEPNWAGNVATLPDGEITCKFEKGICTIPAPPGKLGYTVANAEKSVLLSVQDSSGSIPDLWSAIITALPNEPNGLIFTTRLGGPFGSAKKYKFDDLFFSTDQQEYLAVAVVDKEGNYLFDPPNPTWEGTTAETTTAIRPRQPGAIDFIPEKVILKSSGAKIRVSHETFTAEMPVEILAGKPHRFEMNFPETVAAGTCIETSLKAVDQKGNVTSAVDGPFGVMQFQKSESDSATFDEQFGV